jgi:DNA-binding transcriptional MerR regulator
MAADERLPDDAPVERLPEEIDVEELVAEVRSGLHIEGDQAEEPLPGPVSLDRHLQAMSGTADVTEYRLSTGKSFATGVLVLKRVVEAVVRPYAGHFLDQQSRFNRNVLQAVQYLGRSLDEIKSAIADVGSQQEQLQELVNHHVHELRKSMGQLSSQFDEQYEHLQGAIRSGFVRQGERVDELSEVYGEKMRMLRTSVHESIEVAMSEVEHGFKELAERGEDDRRHLEAEINRNIEAVLELVADLTAEAERGQRGRRVT